MKISEKISTAYGEGVIKLVICDNCTKREAITSESSYDLNDGWYKITKTTYAKGSTYPTRQETEFCSIECIIRQLAPGLLDQDPVVVQTTINGLKRIEQDLSPSGSSII